MKLLVYKGFDCTFLEKIEYLKLFDNCTIDKINVMLFDNKYKKKLEMNLLCMDEEDTKWITYEEFILINNAIYNSIENYNLDVEIIINNMYPDCYPILFEISDDLKNKIIEHNNFKNIDDEKINKIFSVYSEVFFIDDFPYGTFMNFEYYSALKKTKYYAYNEKFKMVDEFKNVFEIDINNNLQLYLASLSLIQKDKPKEITFVFSKGLVSDRIKESLIVFCELNNISIIKYSNDLIRQKDLYDDLIDIAKNVIKIPNFNKFRELTFYKNPLFSHETIEISQGQIIYELITQAEKGIKEKKVMIFL